MRGAGRRQFKIICSNSEQEEAQEELDDLYRRGPGYRLQRQLSAGRTNNSDCSEIECALGDANSSALITVPGNDN